MTSAMKLRLLIVWCVTVSLAGCVSLGSSNFLVTPIAVVGVHSFAPPSHTTRDTDSTVSQSTLTADANR